MTRSSSPRILWIPFSTDGRSGSSVYRCTVPARALARLGHFSLVAPSPDLCLVRDEAIDVVVFQKRYGPHDREFATELKRSGIKVCFDLCDNHLYTHTLVGDQARHADLLAMLGLADLVTTPTPTLAAALSQWPCDVIDDAIAVGRRRHATTALRRYERRDRLRIVWFGTAGGVSPYFGLPDLARVIPTLERLGSHARIKLEVISNDRNLYEEMIRTRTVRARYRAWGSSAAAHRAIAAADVCILPVTLNEFTVGKSANRAVLSLLLDTPVIATPHPAYEGIDDLITVADDLEAPLRQLLERGPLKVSSDAVRRRLQRFSPASVGRQWERALARLFLGDS